MSETDELDSGSAAEVEGTERSENLSTGEYIRLTVLNRVSLLGIGLAIVGAITILLTSPTGLVPMDSPVLGGGLLLVGIVVFAVGFSLGQRSLGEREDW